MGKIWTGTDIPPLEITVHVSDSDESLDLTIQTKLSIVDQVKAISYSNNSGTIQLTNLLKEEIKKYLQSNITISQFCYELKDKVRDALVAHLNQVLADKGRKIDRLNLDSMIDNSSLTPKQLVRVECEVECEVQKYSDPIYVENIILMLPLKTAIYKPNEAYKLEAWVESKLEQIIKPLLLEKKYIDVLLGYEDIAEKIKNQMTEEAKAIGYELNQIVSVPNLEHLELKEDFDLEVETTEFLTNDANVKVKLGISATAKITDFIKIQDYLKPKVEVKEIIEEAISRTISQCLTNISPERYYIRFYQAGINEEGEVEQQSVEEELIEAIKLELEKRFSAEVNRVTIHIYDTEIAKHFKELYGQIGHFEVELSSLTGTERPVKYKGDFQIESVDPNSWYKFQSRKPKIEDISQSIIRSLEAKLTAFSQDDLTYTDLDYLSNIEFLINKWAIPNVRHQFGVIIIITNLYRERTKELDEKSIESREVRSLMAAQKRESVLAELEKLRQKRLQIIDQEDNEDELEDIDKKIDAIEKALSSYLEEAEKNVRKLPSSKTPSLREIAEAENPKLQGSQNNNPILDSSDNNNLPQTEEDEDNE